MTIPCGQPTHRWKRTAIVRSPIPVPASSGIPKSMREFIITLPFNDFEGFERVMRSYGEQIAAVITEPCQGNCARDQAAGWISWNSSARRREEHGCVFILDEVKTGFRIANGGAQEYYDIKPDLATYAKALGNGYPVAAFGGKKEIMSIIGHGVAQGGTYTNNKPGVAGAYATLSLLKSQTDPENHRETRQAPDGWLDRISLKRTIFPLVLTGYPAMFSFSLGVEKVTCQRDWTRERPGSIPQTGRESHRTRRDARPRCPRTLVPVLCHMRAG